MEIPELADLIWLFEDEPKPDFEDLRWPVGLHTFRLTRGSTTVVFSLDPTAGEAYVDLVVDGEPIVELHRLRTLEHLSIERSHPDRETLRLWFRDTGREPLELRTRPTIGLSWNMKSLGSW
ncbi:hypothetical protein [Nocardia sp. NPDC050406]|uniref:hypothetical protein n=1 Tax=Nocardia sp. NPDC050406 TaxID=3364318 RepID=UPI003794E40C